ncbi:MAG: DUF427 domain-containing protein [Parvularculaceae bacterium]
MTDLPPKAELLRAARARRGAWGPRPDDVTPEPAGEGEESVWDYPRPPQIRRAPAPARVVFAGETIAQSASAVRVVETAGAPVYYFPPADVVGERLRITGGVSVCEWKGAAVYYDVVVGAEVAEKAAFAYPDPFDDPDCDFSAIAGWLGFYPGKVEAYVGEERATPQPGGIYAGLVTKAIKGPIKGGPGTSHW